MTTENHRPRLGKAVHKALEYVEYMKHEGVKELPVAKRTGPAPQAKSPPPYQAAPPQRKAAPAPPPMAKPLPALPVVADEVLAAIAVEISQCQKCVLHEKRTKVVPGQGALQPDIMFIGEGPGQDEDEQGLAFVGRAGQLLTKIIEAMGYSRDQVFIGNIVKCRPPNNRQPEPEEMAACMPYLLRQIARIQPKLIVCLGATAVKGLLNAQIGITKLRGTWMSFQGIEVMPTYHPAYLLRNPPAKKDVWEDMKAVLAKLGKKAPGNA